MKLEDETKRPRVRNAVDEYDVVDGGPRDVVDGGPRDVVDVGPRDVVDGGPRDVVDGYDAVDADGGEGSGTQPQALYVLLNSHDVMQLTVTSTALDVLSELTKVMQLVYKPVSNKFDEFRKVMKGLALQKLQTHTHTHTRTHARTHTHTHTHMHARTHARTQIHTNKQTQTHNITQHTQHMDVCTHMWVNLIQLQIGLSQLKS